MSKTFLGRGMPQTHSYFKEAQVTAFPPPPPPPLPNLKACMNPWFSFVWQSLWVVEILVPLSNAHTHRPKATGPTPPTPTLTTPSLPTPTLTTPTLATSNLTTSSFPPGPGCLLWPSGTTSSGLVPGTPAPSGFLPCTPSGHIPGSPTPSGFLPPPSSPTRSVLCSYNAITLT